MDRDPLATTGISGHGLRLLTVVAVVSLCAFAGGCVRRRMTVRTNPPGAKVFVDDQEMGVTPCSASYVYYGTRKITVMKEGFRTETLYQKFYPPWYEIPPLDFVSENLVPREVRDERIVDVELSPDQLVPPQKLIDRAQALREGARTGNVTPLVGHSAAAGPDAPAMSPSGVPGQGLPGGQPLPYEPLPGPGSAIHSSPASGPESLPFAAPANRP